MSEVQKCTSCQNEFDSFLNAPLVLTCNHTKCQSCLLSEFKNQKQNKCSVCNEISYRNPNNLAKNQEILAIIQRKENTQNEQLQNYKTYKRELKLIQKRIAQQQFQSLRQTFLIIQQLFNRNKQVYDQISQAILSLDQNIQVLTLIAKKDNQMLKTLIQNISLKLYPEEMQIL